MESYKTVLKEASDSFIEKRSKFIGHCKPISSEEEALSFIKEKKSKYWDATHNVYAYILKENGIMRYSDDGEPQGTAGVPVLEAMRKSGITDAVVVVTRYFGGTLLGAGGLVRAYSHGSAIAIAAAEPVVMTYCVEYKVRIDYSYFTKAQTLVIDIGGVVTNIEYDDCVNISFYIQPDKFEALSVNFADLTSGKAIFEKIKDGYYGISEK